MKRDPLDYDMSDREQSFLDRQEDARRETERDRQQESAEWSDRQRRIYLAAKAAEAGESR